MWHFEYGLEMCHSKVFLSVSRRAFGGHFLKQQTPLMLVCKQQRLRQAGRGSTGHLSRAPLHNRQQKLLFEAQQVLNVWTRTISRCFDGSFVSANNLCCPLQKAPWYPCVVENNRAQRWQLQKDSKILGIGAQGKRRLLSFNVPSSHAPGRD